MKTGFSAMFLSKKPKYIFLLLSVLVYFCWMISRETSQIRKETTISSRPSKMKDTADEYRNESKKEFMERMKQRMEQRRQLVLEKCKEFGHQSRPVNPMYFIPVRSHKFLFCSVPKTGTSNWRKIILRLLNADVERGKTHNIVRSDIEFNVELPRGMENYLKLMVVREPFTRLVSAYKHWEMENKGTAMNISSVSFEEFVKHLVRNGDDMNETKVLLKLNQHWMTFRSLCDPCHIDYDVIGNLETIQEDSRYVLELLNIADYFAYDKGYGENGTSQSTPDRVSNKYATVNPSLLKQLYQKFKDDYEMFGYPPPNI